MDGDLQPPPRAPISSAMLRLDGIFDRTGRLRRPAYRRLWSELWSLLFHYPRPPDSVGFAHGTGHVVLIVPAALTGDFATQPLRQFLGRCGYRAHGWSLGINWGPTPRLLAGLRRRLRELRNIEGGPVSVVGVSLGGLLARDLAHDCAEDIRQVITLASPFRLPTATTIEPLFHLCALFYAPNLDPERLAGPLPVASTAFFTRDDGIVAWESCKGDDATCRSVEVGGPHVTICRNPEVLKLLAETLAPH
jgi:pimeloyl-ACP methyl ester carboxylesterase